MLKAGSLYYAIFISFILSLIILALFFLARTQHMYIQDSVVHEQVKQNVYSGTLLYSQEPDIVPYNNQKEIKVYDDDKNKAALIKKRWGFFDVVLVSSKQRSHAWEMIILAGNQYKKEDRIGLYMSDKEKYLSIGGATLIKGNSYLPKLGIRRAYIEGRSYENDNLVEGEIKNSEASLPSLSKPRIEKILKYINGGFDKEDSLVAVKNISQLDNINHPFSKRTAIYYLRRDSVLDYINLQGNIILFSEHRLIIDQTCKLNNCIVVSPSIKVKSGFNGCCQLFAMDSLWIESDCKFDFPSVVGALNPTQSNTYVSIGENTVIEGGIILDQELKALKEPYLVLSKGSEVKGIVYCNGIVEHLSSIYGSLYCNGFRLKTDRAYYENHLLDAIIDCKSLSGHYVAPIFFDEEKTKKDVIEEF